MKETVFITGASSGIGRSAALLFASKGYRLILCGRRLNELQQLKALLEEKYQAEALLIQLDVRKKEEVNSAIEKLDSAWKQIDILINNAGLSLGLDTIQEGNTDDWDCMLDTNVKGLLYISRAIVPGMVSRNKGHIVNIGSIAGKEVYLKGNVYCASKHAVDALSKGMRIDLLPHGIRVTAIHPGAVETEFSLVRFKGDSEKAKAVYKGFEPLRPDDIAEAIYYAVSTPTHVNINELVIMPTAQANTSHLIKK